MNITFLLMQQYMNIGWIMFKICRWIISEVKIGIVTK